MTRQLFIANQVLREMRLTLAAESTYMQFPNAAARRRRRNKQKQSQQSPKEKQRSS